MKVGMIGLGNMGTAIARGIYNRGYELILSNRSPEKLEPWMGEKNVTVTLDNSEVIREGDVVFLAVKPDVMPKVLKELREEIGKKEDLWLISMAAGLPLNSLISLSGHEKFIRIMPNTPALVGEGMTAACFPDGAEVPEDKILPLLESFGKVAVLDESKIDAFSGACGCLPAYVFLFLEAAADGAVLEGLPRKDAYKWIAQTILGSAKLYLETEAHPGELKDRVTSPGGSTIVGVKALEEGNFRNAVIEAVEKSVWKNKELGKE